MDIDFAHALSSFEHDLLLRSSQRGFSYIRGYPLVPFFNAINERVDKEYKGNKDLQTLTFRYCKDQLAHDLFTEWYGPDYLLNHDYLNLPSHLVLGSNAFAAVLLNMFFRENGLSLRTVKPSDLGSILNDGDDLSTHIVHTAMVVRTSPQIYNKNNGIYDDIFRQVRDKGFNPSYEKPVMVPLNGFDLVNAENLYGLSLKLREDAELIEAPVLSEENTGENFDLFDSNGLPIPTRGGRRKLFSRSDGLSVLFYNGQKNALCTIGSLAPRPPLKSGRILLVPSS